MDIKGKMKFMWVLGFIVVVQANAEDSNRSNGLALSGCPKYTKPVSSTHCVAIPPGILSTNQKCIEYCKHRYGANATLITVKDKSEDKFYARELIGSTWLGLHRSEEDNTWSWDDGMPLNYTAWADGEPKYNVTGHNCAFVYGRFNKIDKWFTRDCNISTRTACKFPRDDGPVQPPEDVRIMWKGVNALDILTKALKSADVDQVLLQLSIYIRPCLDGWEMFFRKSSTVMAVESDEMKKIKAAYSELDLRLTEIQGKSLEMKELINWDVVKIDLASFESRIRMMGEKLADALRDGVDKEAGTEEYIRVYEDIYRSAGLALFDKIVSNFHSYRENLLKAGLKYGKGMAITGYLKSLLAFCLRASCNEIAFEQFKSDSRAMVDIWHERMNQVNVMMKQTLWYDRETLKDLPIMVERESASIHANNEFVTKLHTKLTQKYWWRNWFVLAYTLGFSSTTYLSIKDIKGNSTLTSSTRYRRSYMVASAPKLSYFNATQAQADIEDKVCPPPMSCPYAAQYLSSMHTDHGVLKLVVSPDQFNYAVKGTPGRHVSGHVTFTNGEKDTVYPLVMFYFG